MHFFRRFLRRLKNMCARRYRAAVVNSPRTVTGNGGGAMRWVQAIGLVALATGLPVSAHAADAAQPRAEVALREVRLPNGARRYAVPMTLGGTAIEAGLDTGSVGLRVLSRATANARVEATTRPTTYSYTSGTRFKGVVAKAVLALGEVSGP